MRPRPTSPPPPHSYSHNLHIWLSEAVNDMQMTQKILEAEGEGDPVQLDFFLKGNLALEKDLRHKPHSWLPDQVTSRLHCPVLMSGVVPLHFKHLATVILYC